MTDATEHPIGKDPEHAAPAGRFRVVGIYWEGDSVSMGVFDTAREANDLIMHPPERWKKNTRKMGELRGYDDKGVVFTRVKHRS